MLKNHEHSYAKVLVRIAISVACVAIGAMCGAIVTTRHYSRSDRPDSTELRGAVSIIGNVSAGLAEASSRASDIATGLAIDATSLREIAAAVRDCSKKAVALEDHIRGLSSVVSGFNSSEVSDGQEYR